MEVNGKVCKLLIITDTYVGVPGGSERHLLNFLTNISPNFQVKVLQLNSIGNPYFKTQKIMSENVELYYYPVKTYKSMRFLSCVKWLYKMSFKYSPDIVISYHEKSDLLNIIVSMLPGTGFKSISSKRDMGLHLDGLFGSLMRVLNKRFTAITAPSKSIIDLVQTEFGGIPSKTHAIPNGLNLLDYGKKIVDRNALKTKLGLPIDKRIIITIGWLRAGKGQEYLIKALSQIDDNENYCLVLLGRGDDEERLRNISSKLGIDQQVLFAGMQSNVNEWLSVSDVAVSSSLSEGLSNALVEAAASELPIIATNVGGNPEVVEDGFNGYLVDCESSNAIKNALTDLFNDPNKMIIMGNNSRRKAEQEFSINNMVKSLEDLYLKVRED